MRVFLAIFKKRTFPTRGGKRERKKKKMSGKGRKRAATKDVDPPVSKKSKDVFEEGEDIDDQQHQEWREVGRKRVTSVLTEQSFEDPEALEEVRDGVVISDDEELLSHDAEELEKQSKFIDTSNYEIDSGYARRLDNARMKKAADDEEEKWNRKSKSMAEESEKRRVEEEQAVLNRMKMKEKMDALKKENDQIKAGVYDQVRCPICRETLEESTDADTGVTSFWCSSRCPIPWFEPSTKAYNFAKMDKRVDDKYKSPNRLPDCNCKQSPKFMYVRPDAKAHKALQDTYLLVCAKKQKEDPCSFVECVEANYDEQSKEILQQIYLNCHTTRVRAGKQNRAAFQSSYANSLKKMTFKEHINLDDF